MRVLVLNGRDEVYKKEAYEVILPGMDGEFSILDFHQPFLYRLRRGIIKIKETSKKNEKEKNFSIKDGLARFGGNSLLVMCEKRV